MSDKYLKEYNEQSKMASEHEGYTYTLSCHRNFEEDSIDENTTKLMAHKENKEGQLYLFNEIFWGLYQIVFNTTAYNMKEWKVNVTEIEGKERLELSKTKSTLWKLLIVDQKAKTYKIQNAFTNHFIYINYGNERDYYSYYLEMTPDSDKATNFIINKAS